MFGLEPIYNNNVYFSISIVLKVPDIIYVREDILITFFSILKASDKSCNPLHCFFCENATVIAFGWKFAYCLV